MKRLMVVAALAGMMCFVTAGALATVFTNGSFEVGTDFSDPYITLTPGAPNLTGWEIGMGSIDWKGSYWQAADGNRSIDLNGKVPGGMYQVFDTIAGTQYQVTFSLAGNFHGDPDVKSLVVWAKNSNGDPLGGGAFTFDKTGKTADNMGWTDYSFLFNAASNSSLLELLSTTTFPIDQGEQRFGPAVDNFRVSAVPIPGTLVLLGSGLLGLVGIARRNSRK